MVFVERKIISIMPQQKQRRFMTMTVRIMLIASLLLFTAWDVRAENYRIVDMQRVLKEATSASGIRNDITKKQEKFKKEVSKKEEELRKADKSLLENRNILSQEEFERQRGEFKERLIAIQRDVQVKRSEIDKTLRKALSEVENAVAAVISELSAEMGFDLALPRSQVLYHKTSLDITDEVLKRLNKKLPKVKLQ